MTSVSGHATPNFHAGMLLRLLLMTAVVCAISAPVAYSQSPAKEQTGKPVPSTETVSVQAIPLAEIGMRAQEAVQVLRRMTPLTEADAEIDSIGVELRLLSDSLEVRRKHPVFREMERLPRRSLADLSNEWTRYRRIVKRWEESLLAKSDMIGAAMDQLNGLESVWRETRDSVRASRAPLPVRRQVELSLSTITSRRVQLENRFREILSLQEKITGLAVELNEDLERMAIQVVRIEHEIFVFDAPPLWKTLALEADTSGVVGTVEETWAASMGATILYLSANDERLVFHLVFAVVCLVLFVLLRREVLRLAGEDTLPDPLPASVRLLSRPLAASLLVTVFVARYIYPAAPVGFTDILRLVLVVPFVWLALVWLEAGLRWGVIVLGILFVLDLTHQLIVNDPAASRLVLLTETTVATLALGFIMRPGSRNRFPGTVLAHRFLHRVGAIALFLLVAGLAANVVGSVSLSRRLTSGVVFAFAAAVFYRIIVLLASGALFFSVRYWLSRISRLTRRFQDRIVKGGMRVFAFAGLVGWFLIVLNAIGMQSIVLDWLGRTLQTEWGFGAVQITALDLILFLAVLVGTFVMARVLRLGLEEEVFSRISLPRGVPGAISMVVRYSVVGLGIVLAMGALGIDLGKFGLLAGALGIGLGFGLQNVVANFISGIILAIERPIQVGDMLQKGSLWGKVSSIGVRSTVIRSFDGSEVIIPNNDLITKEVTNWTLTDNLRQLRFPVKVEFGSDPKEVIEVMLSTARTHSVPLKSPEPFVIFEGVGEYYLDFTLHFWITTGDYLVGKNEVGMAVLAALKSAGIRTPAAPHRVMIEEGETRTPPPKRKLGRRPPTP